MTIAANGPKSKQHFKKRNNINYDQFDDYTQIVPIPSESHPNIDNAVMISGFPSAGMIGSIVCAQLIEQLGMHQIAFVYSKYIMPGVLWIGGKLRHPFRIYCNKDGSVCVLTCDVPVFADAMDSISNAITMWCNQNKVSKLLVASGIYPENIQPFPKDFASRSAFLIKSDSNLKNAITEKGKVNGTQTPRFSFIGGLPGQLLGTCVVQSIPCLAILVPTLSFAPDPEGAALAIEAIGNIVPKAKVSYSHLKQEADRIKKQLSELAKLQSRLLKNDRAENMSHDDAEHIYK
jgi:uncharacterized protein